MKTIARYFASIVAETVRTITSVQKLRQTLCNPLHANSLYLMLNSGVNAGVGFIFWIVAARFYSTKDVGLGSALISAATLLAFIASLGLGHGLIRFLPDAGEQRQGVINSSLSLITLASLVVCAIFLAGLPIWSPVFLGIRENPVFAVAFVVFVITWGLYSIMANIFVGFRRAGFTLASGTIYNVLRIACVAALALMLDFFGIFASWGIAGIVALAVSLIWFLPRVLPRYRPGVTLQRQAGNEMLRFSFANYVSSNLWSAPQLILPIMVVNLLGAAENAYFYMAWMVASLLVAIPLATSTSLFAEGSHQVEYVGRDLWRSLKLTMVLLIPAMAILLVLGEKILLLFGGEYSVGGARLLWFLVPAALPVSINLLYLAVARVRKRLKDIVLVTGCVAVGTLVTSYFLLPQMGIWGAGVGWLATQSLVALALLPKLRSITQKKEAVTVSK